MRRLFFFLFALVVFSGCIAQTPRRAIEINPDSSTVSRTGYWGIFYRNADNRVGFINSAGTRHYSVMRSDVIQYNRGGTGLNTLGSNGQVLQSNGSAVIWATPASGGFPIDTLYNNYIRKDFDNPWNVTNSGFSQVYGVRLVNTYAATSTVQQRSPVLTLSGNGWKTNATASSVPVRFHQQVQTASGAAAPTGQWKLSYTIGGGSEQLAMNYNSFSDRLTVNGSGGLYSTAEIVSTTGSVQSQTSSFISGRVTNNADVAGVSLTNATASTNVTFQPSTGVWLSGSVWDTGASASRAVLHKIRPRVTSGNPGYGVVEFTNKYHTGTENVVMTLTPVGVKPGTYTSAQIASLTGMVAGDIIFCSDCTATAGGTGVHQGYNSSGWHNMY